MKKFFTLCLSLIMLLSLAACNGSIEPEPPTEAPTLPQPSLPPENTVGGLCSGYDLPVVTAEGETGEIINPIKTGKVTVINFWGTWCGPCVSELPHLQELAKNYSDTVTVIAVHSVQEQRKMTSFLAENYPDSPIIFSWEKGEGYNGEFCMMLGGGQFYPYTVVLDAQGIITETKVGSMSYEEMVALVENAGA